MRIAWVRYRIRQFWNALRAKPHPKDLTEANLAISPKQFALFARLQPGEQAHSIQMYRRLQAQGEDRPDLLVAALLHDVGKCLYPLRLWERALIVLAKMLVPGIVKRWSAAPPLAGEGDAMGEGRLTNGIPDEELMRTWRRAFLIADGHPAWGAVLAAQAGTTPLACALIRRHAERPGSPGSLEDQLLRKLQSVDDES